MSILAGRLERVARHERGLSYDVDGDVVPLGHGERLYAIAVDAREGREAPVLDLLWQGVCRLAADGPGIDEIALELAAVREMFDDPRYVEVDLAQAAEAELFDEPYPPRWERLAALEQVGAEQIGGLLSAALPTTQLVAPYDVTVALPGVTRSGCACPVPLPPGRVFQPSLVARLFARHTRGLRLVLTPATLAQRDPDGEVHVVEFADVIGVEVRGSARTVFGAGGCQIEVDPALFPGSEAVLTRLAERVPAELFYERSALLPDAAD